MKPLAGVPWAKEEEEILKTLYLRPIPESDFVKALPNRTLPAIKCKIHSLGLHGRISFLEQPRKLNLTETEKAYLAGLIDGEGSIHFALNTGETIIPKISISNSNTEVLEWCRNKIGRGYISTLSPHSFEGSFHRQTHQFIIQAKPTILPVLEAIFPFLIIKKKQAKLVLEWCKSRLSRENYHRSTYTKREVEIIKEVKRLNAKTRRGGAKKKRHEKLLSVLEEKYSYAT